MMYQEFQNCVELLRERIETVRTEAHKLHESVNQTYDKVHPYGFHLDMVADSVYKFGNSVCASEEDVLPLFFGAFFHDSIEDARLTYNNVLAKAADCGLNEAQAHMAAEIVYALTNDKGRTRTERAGERYYQGIRETPYAPFVKLADRLANTSYSCNNGNEANAHMREVYARELPHFLEAIDAKSTDPRFALPEAMITILNSYTAK